MPRVPALQDQIGSANPVNTGRDIAPARSFVGVQTQQLAGGLFAFGAATAAQGRELQAEADDARSRRAASLYVEESERTLAGFEQMTGEAAVNGYEDAQKAVGDLRSRFAGTLETDTQRQLYARMIEGQRLTNQRRTDSHRNRQLRTFNVGQAEAAANLAARNYQSAALLADEHDDERMVRMEVERGVMLGELDRFAELQGFSPEQRRELRQDRLAELHRTTLSAIARTDARQAREYFEEHGDEFAPAVRAQAKALVDAADLRDRSLGKAREWWADTAKAGAATPTERLAAAMDRAAKITDADEYDAVTARLSAEYSLAVRIESGERNDTATDIAQAVSAGAASFSELDPELQVRIRAQGMLAEAQQAFRLQGRDRESDEQLFLSALYDPGQLVGMSPEVFERTYKPRLASGEYDTVTGLWARANNQPVTSARTQNVLAADDILRELLERNGYSSEELKDDPERQRAAFRLRAAVQREVEQRGLTADMSFDDKFKVIEKVFLERATAAGRDVPVAATEPGATVEVVLPDGSIKASLVGIVPDVRDPRTGEAGVATRIKEALRVLGIEPTERLTQQVYYALGEPKDGHTLERRRSDPKYSPRLQLALQRGPADWREQTRAQYSQKVLAAFDQWSLTLPRFPSAGPLIQFPKAQLRASLPEGLTATERDDVMALYYALLIPAEAERFGSGSGR